MMPWLLACGGPVVTSEIEGGVGVLGPEAPYDNVYLHADICLIETVDRRWRKDGRCIPAYELRCSESTRCILDEDLETVLVEHEDGNRAGLSRYDGAFPKAYEWSADAPLQPGLWSVVALDGDTELAQGQFEVPASVAPPPGVWRLLPGDNPVYPQALLLAYVEAWLVLDEPDEQGRAQFTVVGRYNEPDFPQCRFLTGTAQMEAGEFRWQREELTANTEPSVTTYDLDLRAWFVEDGTGRAVQAAGLIDMRHTKTSPDTEGICKALAGFAIHCDAPCPDGQLQCLDVDLRQMRLEPVEPIEVEDLAACGVDTNDPETQEIWSCDFSWGSEDTGDTGGGSSSGGWLCSSLSLAPLSWSAALLAFALLRRRPES